MHKPSLSSHAFSLFGFVILALCFHDVYASPRPPSRLRSPRNELAPQSMTLHRRQIDRTAEEWGQWAKSHKLSLESKYGKGKHSKRATGTN